MESLHTKSLHLIKKIRLFFKAQTMGGVWVRLLCSVVLLNVIGILFSLLFFWEIRGMNQAVISNVVVPKTGELDGAGIRTTLDAFSRRVVEFEYRKVHGVSIPEPR